MKLIDQDQSSLFLKDIKNFVSLKKVGDRQSDIKRETYLSPGKSDYYSGQQELTIYQNKGISD
jgi:hypothetical protein